MASAEHANLTIQVFGLRWNIDLAGIVPQHAELVSRLRHLWSRATVPPDGTEMRFGVVPRGESITEMYDGVPLGATLGESAAFPYELSRAITLASLARRAGSALLLHAAGLATADGRTLVLVAGSGTGKSTAARSLGREWGYVSDETVVIERDLTISPHPKPISLAAPDRPGDKDEFAPDDLGFGTAPAGCRVGAVVVMQRSPDFSTPTLEPMTLIDGMLAVIAHSGSINLLTEPLQWLAAAVSSGGGPYRLHYADIDDCRDLLAGIFSRSGSDGSDLDMTAPWAAHQPRTAAQRAGSHDDPAEAPPRAEPGSPTPIAGSVTTPVETSVAAPVGFPGAVVRAPWTDAIEAGGEILVLTGRRPMRLSGIGATLWLAAEAPRTFEELVAVAVQAHGENPAAQALVAEAASDLRKSGLLEEASVLEIVACGVRWRIDISALEPQHSQLAQELSHLWRRAARHSADERSVPTADFSIVTGNDPIPRDDLGIPRGVRLGFPEQFPYAVSRAITLASASVRRADTIMFHAAGLTLPESETSRGNTSDMPAATAILVGPSGAGKSTAARMLGRNLGYVTDEAVVVDRDLTAFHHEKPISLTRADLANIDGSDAGTKAAGGYGKVERSPDDLGLLLAPPHLTVGAIVLLQRGSAQTSASLERVALIDALEETLPQIPSVEYLEHPLAWLATALVRGGGPYRLTYSEIDDCAPLIAELVSDAAADSAERASAGMTSYGFVHHPPTEHMLREADAVVTSSPVVLPRYVRAPWADAVEVDSEILLLREGTSVRLSGIGATIWLAAGESGTLEPLIGATVEAHGHHRRERSMTAVAVEELIARGVLCRTPQVDAEPGDESSLAPN